MPRIRNLHDLIFFRPDENVHYEHIDSLFKDKIDWELIQAHWFDMMRVILSVGAGKISSPTLLRKLGTESKKNQLYLAFRELGRAIRTEYLLRFVSDLDMRRRVTAETNKAEAYNKLSKWVFFGGKGIVADNDPDEQEKAIKYNDLIANALILQNAADMTKIAQKLAREDFSVKQEDIAAMSPYITLNTKRFGDYALNKELIEELVYTLGI
jgi:TnpA family transposase